MFTSLSTPLENPYFFLWLLKQVRASRWTDRMTAGYIRSGGEMLDYRSPVSARRHERVRGDYTHTVYWIIPRLDTLTRPHLHAKHLPLLPDRHTHIHALAPWMLNTHRFGTDAAQIRHKLITPRARNGRTDNRGMFTERARLCQILFLSFADACKKNSS